MGNGSEVACGAVGLPDAAKLTVTSMASVSCTVASGGSSVRGASGGTTSGASVSTTVGGTASLGAVNSSIFCHSSPASSTSASKSAPARQLGQMKMGYCGEVSKERTHLKCHV